MPIDLTSASSRHRFARRRFITADAALTIAGLGACPATSLADPNSEISRSEEAIHQKRTFTSDRGRVYAALTVEDQFDRIVRLSGVTKDAEAKMRHPTRLSPHVGGAFALFDGYIVGRQLELAPNELIVQAWRVLSWPRGMYSIARFEFFEQAGVTTIVLDHTGFPNGTAEHLASGWQEHYWDPLIKVLA